MGASKNPKDIKTRGLSEVNENMIFEAYARLQHIEENAVGNTAAKKRLRNKTKKAQASEKSIKNLFVQEEHKTIPQSAPAIDRTKIRPFEDLQHEPFK